jgi:hypothetical protein
MTERRGDGGWENLKEDLPLEGGRLIFDSFLRDDQFIKKL